jgi:hypothetical protein
MREVGGNWGWGRARRRSAVADRKSPGYEAALSGVEERLARADVALADQRSGLLGVHTNAIRKQELRSTMRDAHLAHIAQVAKAARREAPEVTQLFVFRPGTSTHIASRPRRARS